MTLAQPCHSSFCETLHLQRCTFRSNVLKIKARSLALFRVSHADWRAVEIAFAKKSLRQICESERSARRLLGRRVAQRLKIRLADIQIADSVSDLVAGRPRELVGDCTGHVAVDLDETAMPAFR